MSSSWHRLNSNGTLEFLNNNVYDEDLEAAIRASLYSHQSDGEAPAGTVPSSEEDELTLALQMSLVNDASK